MLKKCIVMISMLTICLINSMSVLAAVDPDNNASKVTQETTLPWEEESIILDGDMSIEEGAAASIPEADEIMNIEKLAAMNAWLSSRISGPAYMNLKVPTCQQINNYYCGPATVQQTIKFYKGSAPSQDSLASQLGTTTAGTDMTKIAGVINNNLGYSQYSMIAIGTEDDWINKVTYALSINKPVILDIKAQINDWPYNTNGHFLNVSGYNRSVSPHQTKVTDPWEKKLGDSWYSTSVVYKVNYAHFRRAMIW